MGQERDIQLGKYHLKTRLGKGGMGVVYLATDSRLKRDVAVKILPRSLSSNPVAVKRFLREARVAASISHPCVVTVHDVDQINGQCFLVMELMTGGTAQDLIQDGPLDWSEATRVIAETCQGLAAIHEAGLIHRDIKPSNIMLAAQGAVKLTDFGLAKVTDSSLTSKPLTQSNSILGTPQFMSPEQCQGDELDTRCDLYSLGATYFALLTGVAPFPDPQPLQCMFAHCSTPVPDPRKIKSEIPAESVAIIMKAMAKQRSERFATAREMLDALQACLRVNGADSVSPGKPASAKPAVSATLHSDSDSFGKSSTNPGSSTLPLIDPGKTTVEIKAGRKKRPAQQRTTIIAIACSIVLLVGLTFWAFSGGTRPPKLAEVSVPVVSSGRSAVSLPAKRNAAPADHGASPLRLTRQATLSQFGTMIYDVAFATDGRSFFSGAADGKVQRWSLSAEQPTQNYAGASRAIRAVANHQKWLAAGGEAKTIWLWDIHATRPPLALSGLSGVINSLAFSPDGTRLAVGTDEEVNLYQLDNRGAQLFKVLGVSNYPSSTGRPPISCYMVESVSFSSDSGSVAATSWTDGTVAVWDAVTGQLKKYIQHVGHQPMAVAFLPDQDRVVFSSGKGSLSTWQVGQDSFQLLPASHAADVRYARSLAVTPDGRYVASVGEWGGRINLYQLHGGSKQLEVANSTGTASNGLDISPDGTMLVMSGGDKDQHQGFIQLWKIDREASE